MPGKIKVNFKMPPETAAEKMHRRQQELRKKSGLPDPSHYKNLAAQKQKEIDAMKNEEAELLDEMPESSMKTRDVHAHLKKAGWALKRTGGGHDVYAHPKSKEHIAVPRHKQLKAPLIRGIMKASRVSEEVDIDEQLEQKGKFVSGPVKKPYKSPTVASPMREAKDPREYDYEGDMAMSQLRSLMFNAQDMMDLMEDNTNLPEWVQSKITLAEDYISSAANYLRGELNEDVQIDEASKYAKMFDKMVKQRELNKLPKPPKSEYESKVDKYLKKKYQKEEVELEEGLQQTLRKVVPGYAKKQINDKMDREKFGRRDVDKDENYHRYKKIMDKLKKEEVELQEGRPSQRHPLEGHDYHKKSNAELIGIAKDAHEAAEAMKGHSTRAENKYRDQANDSATVRYFRQKSGMPDWYKKKYGHVKEEVVVMEGAGMGDHRYEIKHKDVETGEIKSSKVRAMSPKHARQEIENHYSHSSSRWKHIDTRKIDECVKLEEENKPTNPELWSKAKSMAKSKFDVYPSAYANGWAAKKYKEMGGSWKSVKEETEKPASRKAQIVRDLVKDKKNQEETSDKFQKDPEISSEIQKN